MIKKGRVKGKKKDNRIKKERIRKGAKAKYQAKGKRENEGKCASVLNER